MIAFRLDVIIGAIGLRDVYPIPSQIMFVMLLLVMIILLIKWAWSTFHFVLVSLLFCPGLILLSTSNVSLLDMIAICSAIGVYLLPTQTLLVLFIGILVIWRLVKRKLIEFSDRLLKFVTIALLVFSSLYLLGVGKEVPALFDFERLDYIEFEGNPYYLEAFCCTDSFGTGYGLTLYQCTLVSVFCQPVFEDDYVSYDVPTSSSLLIDAQSNQLNLIVDGEILYQHSPN